MSERTYVLTATREQDETNWSIVSADFPEIASVAETQAELTAQVRDALDSAIAARREDGEDLPEPGTAFSLPPGRPGALVAHFILPIDMPDTPVRVNVSLDVHLLSRIDREAERRQMTRSGFLAEGAKQLMRRD